MTDLTETERNVLARCEPLQELGGVMVTLSALASCHDMDLDNAAETELERVWMKIEKIRAKQLAKPKHSPLPEAQPQSLTGCLHPSEFGCQFYGKCLSVACNHYNKTECRPRMTLEAQVDGILYPTKETR